MKVIITNKDLEEYSKNKMLTTNQICRKYKQIGVN